jgi:hypothetical protein
MEHKTNSTQPSKIAGRPGAVELSIFVLLAIVVLELARQLVGGVGFGILACLVTYAAISFPFDLYFTRKKQSRAS